ncbi:MAG: FlxA-like family protein [Tepidisphaeraceae bacterium]
MFASRRRVCPALVVLAIGLGAGAARADDASTQQMQQKIDQLESKVEALEAQQNQTQAQSTSDGAATMSKIQSDANSQSQLLSPGTVGSGYDPATGFHISSDDGNFYLHPWVLSQFRGAINDRQSIQPAANNHPNGGAAVPGSGSKETDGFEIHHLMLGANGHVMNLQYYLMIDTPSTGGGETLQDAYCTYRFGDTSPIRLKAGQFVDPVWHESNVDDGHLLAVDRSLVGVLLGGNTGLNNGAERVQGIGLKYDSDFIRGEFDLTDGYNTANTPFFNTPAGANLPATDFGWSGRVEVKVLGDETAWDGYNSLSAEGDKTDSIIAGGGFEWTEAANFDNIFLTIDGQYTSPTGLNLYAALLENYAAFSDNGQPPQSALNQAISGTYPNFGFIAQGGYKFTPEIEGFARYDLAILNSRFADVAAFGNKNPGPGSKATANNHEFTVGVNYYLYGYRAKVTGDLSFLPNGSAVDAPGLGILANQGHSEWVGRVQFQLAI